MLHTVILNYPDYLRQNDAAEPYINVADTPSPRDAVTAVREQARQANEDTVEDGNDFALIAVFQGDCVLELDATDEYYD